MPGVDVALAVPHVHAPAELLLDVGAEPHVGAEQDLGVLAVGLVDVAHDVDRVGRGAAVVGQRLDLGGRVDVHHDDPVRVLRAPGGELVGVDRGRQRAAGVEVGDQHRLLGAQDRGRLGHEVHAAEDDRRSPSAARGLPREAERVADVVGDVLDLGHLVVVGEDHGVARSARARATSSWRARDLLGDRPEAARGGYLLSRGHGQVHGSTSRISERSRAGAECVSAPIEIHSTPVLATRPQRLEASRRRSPRARARPATCATAARSCATSMLSSSSRGAPAGQRLVDLRGVAHLDLERRRAPGARSRARATAAAMPPGGRDVVLLDQDRVVEARRGG